MNIFLCRLLSTLTPLLISFGPLTFGTLALVVDFNAGFALTLGGRTGRSQLTHTPVLHTVRAAHLVVTVFAHAHSRLGLLLQLFLVLLGFNALETARAPCNRSTARPARLSRSGGAQLAAAARVHHPERAARRGQRGARARVTGPAGA